MTDQLPSGINPIFCFSNRALRNTVIRAINETSGIAPVLKKDTTSAQRAHYAPAESSAIINVPSPAMHKLLGKHSGGIAIKVDDPVAAAHMAQEIFLNDGYLAYVHTHAEPEFPDGFIVFVAVPELNGIVLLFWPKNPDPAILRKLDGPELWTEADYHT